MRICDILSAFFQLHRKEEAEKTQKIKSGHIFTLATTICEHQKLFEYEMWRLQGRKKILCMLIQQHG